ncbi:CubicO group peptidase, beta-lactamase class C family [Prauserella aidingensis]|uniref:serine hydrolase domain-containing protein n=1 Tax=Prauserella aidingensis TaxID=387890 RepID=UPI0020A36D72|nr:serine hydrolase domain-containing protein [Prauserella aidingensis]MCP2252025.1 CubicO group peptidase, beta-lactamase class C family [Prauserella aidingensis]
MLPTTELVLNRRVATEQVAGRAPSLAAAVVRDGEITWWGARGTVDGARPDRTTQYRIGSITKSIVAAAVLRLRDEGLLDLGDPLDKHVPGTTFGGSTIAQLLSHTSGLTSESPGAWWERSPGGGWTDLSASLTPDETKHRPGRRFHYSNVGYGVLGRLVTAVRGADWLDVVRAEILEPLGMRHTAPMPGEHGLTAATGYAVHPFADVLLPEPAHDAGAMAPAGQLWSTLDDLARWTAFTGGRTGDVLDPGTVAEMREAATVDDSGGPWTAGYGLGFQLIQAGGKRLAGHTGSMPGFLACTLIDPATQTGAVTFANTTSGVGIAGLTADLISIADDHEPPLPAEWTPSPVEPRLLELTGLWHWGPKPYHLYALPDGWLNLTPADGAGRASRFRPIGDDRWLGLDGYYAGETLTVGRVSDGTPTYLDLATFVFTRTPYDPNAPVPGGVDPEGWRA